MTVLFALEPDSLPVRLAVKIRVNPQTGCWEWQGQVNPNGYGQTWWGSPRKKRWVHRLVYQLLVGPIPDDRPHLDHVYAWGCRSKACCWPGHLEPVTPAENARRRAALITHCPKGHEYSAENTTFEATGSRKCRICRAAHYRDLRVRQAAEEGREVGPPMAERTHCPHGHEYTPENTFFDRSGSGRTGRKCRTCRRDRLRAWRQAS